LAFVLTVAAKIKIASQAPNRSVLGLWFQEHNDPISANKYKEFVARLYTESFPRLSWDHYWFFAEGIANSAIAIHFK
jgi:hypothetical protein